MIGSMIASLLPTLPPVPRPIISPNPAVENNGIMYDSIDRRLALDFSPGGVGCFKLCGNALSASRNLRWNGIVAPSFVDIGAMAESRIRNTPKVVTPAPIYVPAVTSNCPSIFSPSIIVPFVLLRSSTRMPCSTIFTTKCCPDKAESLTVKPHEELLPTEMPSGVIGAQMPVSGPATATR